MAPPQQVHRPSLRVPTSSSFVHDEYTRDFCEKFEEDGDYGDSAVGYIRYFDNERYDGCLAHLTGCTAVIIASRAGVFLSHYEEIGAFRASEDNYYNNVDNPNRDDKRAFQRVVLDTLLRGSPSNLNHHRSQIFHPSFNPQIRIITPSHDEKPGMLMYEYEIEFLGRFLRDLLGGGVQCEVVTYERQTPMDLVEEALFNTSRGKVLVQYDPVVEWWEPQEPEGEERQVAGYRVWLESRPEPIMEDTWDVEDERQMVERPEDCDPH